MSLDRSRPLVYFITDGECDTLNYIESSRRTIDHAVAAAAAGVDLIQIREKRLSGKLLFDLTERAADALAAYASKLIVNDRLDVALGAKADGVHLTSISIPVREVRPRMADGFLIGVSCHAVEEVVEARDGGADFALFGPVFASPGKGEGAGLEALANVCRSAGDLPVIAVGGIGPLNCRSAIDRGAAGIAAIRSLNDSTSLSRIMKELGR